jgi:hypothetical protein
MTGRERPDYYPPAAEKAAESGLEVPTMRTGALGILLIGCMALRAQAGVVGFDPPEVFVQPGEPAVFEVSVASTTLSPFDAVTLWIQADYPDSAMQFDYAASFLASATLPPPPPMGGCKWWDCGIIVGGNRLVAPTDPTAWRAPLLVGTLTVGTTGMAPGSFFDVFVSGDGEEKIIGSPLSVVASAEGQEALNGSGRVMIVPEPGMLLMLAVASAASVAGHWRASRQWHPGHWRTSRQRHARRCRRPVETGSN